MISPLMAIGANVGMNVLTSVTDQLFKPSQSAEEKGSFDALVRTKQKDFAVNYQKALSLIGSTVEVKGADGISMAGFVEKVGLSPTGPILEVNGQFFTMDQLQRVLTRELGGRL